MLTELCAELRNYFLGDYPMRNIHRGTFTISGGSIAPLDFLKENQYFRIVGSTFNDGVYQYPAIGLTDETFAGAVWAMAVPPAVIALADEEDAIKIKISEYARKETGYSSESYPNGYSYSNPSNLPVFMQEEIADIKKRKNSYRRMNVL